MASEFFAITLSTIDREVFPPRTITQTTSGLIETDGMTREEVFRECQRRACADGLSKIVSGESFDYSTLFYHIETNIPVNSNSGDE